MSEAQRDVAGRAEALGAVLPPLVVAAERIAASVAAGLHGRRQAGPGEAFWQFRRYQPGDSVRAIDWRRSAKSDPLYVREREWAAAQTVWLWCDRSPSMAWRSAAHLPTKAERAALLTLALAALLVRGGERVAQLGADERPVNGRGAFLRLADRLARPESGGGRLEVLARRAPLPRHAAAVLIGDLFDPLPVIAEAVRALGSGRGHLVQVCDPAEEALPFSGRVRFAGLEGERELTIAKVEDIRARYTERLAEHRAGLADLARRLSWTFAIHRTDAPPATALMALYLTLRSGGDAHAG